MTFDAHGKYDLQVRGEIFIIRFYQNWNIECAKEFFEVYKAFILKQRVSQFGVIADFCKVEGGTPEAIAYFEKITEWAQANGQIARAQIINSDLKKYMVNKSSQGKVLFPIQSFDDVPQAMAWLESLGLNSK